MNVIKVVFDKKKLMKGDKNDGPYFLNVFDVVLRVLKKIED